MHLTHLDRHFAENVFKYIFLNKIVLILIHILFIHELIDWYMRQ